MGLENLGPGKHDVRAMGNDLAPEFPARSVYRRGHEAEGAPAGISADIKRSVIRNRGQPGMSRGKRARMMIGVIFMVVFARSDDPKFSVGLRGAQEADFAGGMTGDGQQQKISAARAF